MAKPPSRWPWWQSLSGSRGDTEAAWRQAWLAGEALLECGLEPRRRKHLGVSWSSACVIAWYSCYRWSSQPCGACVAGNTPARRGDTAERMPGICPMNHSWALRFRPGHS
jgi:hypothetical protein